MITHRYERREFLKRLACLTAGGSAAALLPQLRMLGTAMAAPTAAQAFPGYKALVCIYLAGGNDAWNTLIPLDSRYATYSAARGGIYDAGTNPGGLALDSATLTPLTGATGSGSSNYALHPSLTELSGLYDAQKLAVVVNAGPLTKPITKTDYNNIANRPAQLYSHSDQEDMWHIGSAKVSPLGWGGQTAKLVMADNVETRLAPCISISGSNKYEVGQSLVPYQLLSGGLTGLSSVCNPPAGCGSSNTARDTALNAMLSDTYSATMTNEFAKIFKRGRDLYALLNTGLASINLDSYFPAQNTNALADQLKMVARMIKLSRDNGYATRQIYYVRLGGFDLHDSLMNAGTSGHSALLAKVSLAMSSFWNALGDPGINSQNNVTAFTMSEFGRTLSSNGSGSDHAWGTVQLVLGGDVVGGKLYMDGGGPVSGFPNQLVDGTSNNTANPMAFGRGQIIPGIGVEQYAATLAQWMGVTGSVDLDAIFPNLAQFNPAFRNLGFLS